MDTSQAAGPALLAPACPDPRKPEHPSPPNDIQWPSGLQSSLVCWQRASKSAAAPASASGVSGVGEGHGTVTVQQPAKDMARNALKSQVPDSRGLQVLVTRKIHMSVTSIDFAGVLKVSMADSDIWPVRILTCETARVFTRSVCELTWVPFGCPQDQRRNACNPGHGRSKDATLGFRY